MILQISMNVVSLRILRKVHLHELIQLRNIGVYQNPIPDRVKVVAEVQEVEAQAREAEEMIIHPATETVF